MNKKRGFTLVELIVTIALLGLIGSIIAVNMVGLYKKQDQSETARIESIIKSAAETYLEVEQKSGCVSVEELIKQNYLKENEIKDYKDKYVEIVNGELTIKSDQECNSDTKYLKVTYKSNLKDEMVQNLPRDNTKYKKGDYVTLNQAVPTTNGYNFVGWSKKENGNILTDLNTKITKNLNLYAIWTKKNFNVTYDLNGGTSPNINTASVAYKDSYTITSEEPVKAGYVFKGWRQNDNYSSNETDINYKPNDKITVTKNITLKAIYKQNTFTITYVTNGGTEIESKSYDYGTKTTEPDAPTRGIDIFDGWYEDAKFNVKHKFETMPAKNITLYAKWIKNFKFELVFKGKNVTAENIPKTINENESLNINLSVPSGYGLESITCSNAVGSVENNVLNVKKAINDVRCEVSYMQNVYIVLNTNRNETNEINNMRTKLKENGILATIRRKNIGTYSGYKYDEKNIFSDSSYIFQFAGVLGNNVIYILKYEADTNKYIYRLYFYNIYDDELNPDFYNLSSFCSYNAHYTCDDSSKNITKGIKAAFYDNTLYFANFDSVSENIDGHKYVNCNSYYQSRNSTYCQMNIDYYALDSVSDNPDYLGYAEYKTRSVVRKSTTIEYDTNFTPVLYSSVKNTFELNCKNCSSEQSAYNQSIEIPMPGSTSISPYYVNNDNISLNNVPDQIKDYFKFDNIKNSLGSSVTNLKVIGNCENKTTCAKTKEENEYLIFKNKQGEYGTIVTYKSSRNSYVSEVIVKDQIKYALQSDFDNEISYKRKYYVVDMRDVDNLDPTYSNGTKINYGDFNDFKTIYFDKKTNIVNNSNLPSGINYINAYYNKLIEKIQKDLR